MQKIKKLLDKVLKESGDEHAVYLYGVEHHSDLHPTYQALIRFSKSNPLVFSAQSEKKLISQIEDYIKGGEEKDINIRYFREKIEQSLSEIRFYEKQIKDYEEGKSPQLLSR